MGFQLFKAMTFIFQWKTLALVLPWLLLMKYSRYRMTYFYASSPFSSVFFFFIIPLLIEISRRHFYLPFSTLVIAHFHTHTNIHIYCQSPPSTTCWLSISKGHSQPLPIPGCRWHCLALSLELAPLGHCFLYDIIRVLFLKYTLALKWEP